MKRTNIRRGRPRGALGPLARLVLDYLDDKALTTREIAAALQIAVNAVKYTCSRLVAAGLLAAVPADTRGSRYRRARSSGYLVPTALPAAFFAPLQ